MAAFTAKTDKETMSPPAPQKQGDAKPKNPRNQKKNYRNKPSGPKPTTPETPAETLPEKIEPAAAPKVETPAVSAPASDEEKNQPATATAFEIGWMFVQQYYTFMNKSPRRLHCFYKSKSAMVRGNESDDLVTFYGQKGIHQRIMELNYNNCKVLISNVDVQASLFGSIIIMVLGELSNNNEPTQRFAQTFVLCEQQSGFFILNDIFRFLKDTNNSDVQGVGFVGVELEDGEFKVVNLPEKDSLAPTKVDVSAPEKSSDVSEVASLKAEPATPVEEKSAEPSSEPIKEPETPDAASQAIAPETSATASSDDSKNSAEVPAKARSEDKPKETEAAPTNKNEKSDAKSSGPSKGSRASNPQEAKAGPAPKGTWAHLAGSGLASNTESSDSKKTHAQESASKDAHPASQKAQTPRELHREHNLNNSVCLRGLKEPVNRQLIREVFSAFGPVKYIDPIARLVFLEFENPESCAKALENPFQIVGDEKITVEARRAKGTPHAKGKSRNSNGPRKGSRTTEGSSMNGPRQPRQGGARPVAPQAN